MNGFYTESCDEIDFLGIEMDGEFLLFRSRQMENSINELEYIIKDMCPCDPLKEHIQAQIDILKFMLGCEVCNQDIEL